MKILKHPIVLSSMQIIKLDDVITVIKWLLRTGS